MIDRCLEFHKYNLPEAFLAVMFKRARNLSALGSKPTSITIEVNGKSLTLPIEWQKRKTLSVVHKGGSFTIRAPLAFSYASIVAFLREKSWWLEKMDSQTQNTNEDNENIRRQIFEENKITLPGGTLEYVFELGKGVCSLQDGRLHIGLPQKHLDSPEVKEKALPLALKWYAQLYFSGIVRAVLDDLPAPVRPFKQVKISDAKGRWGSCHSDGTIRLSWRLLFVSKEELMYVILHEIAHLTHMNHSTSFWALVESYMPDYREYEKRLKKRDIANMPL